MTRQMNINDKPNEHFEKLVLHFIQLSGDAYDKANEK